MGDRGRKMFALLILPSAALAAWRPAPGIPLERQLPTNRQTSGFFSNSGSEAACDWETMDFCDMGMDENNCWMGNWCQEKSLGGCPSTTGSGSSDNYDNYSGSTCFDAYTQDCNSTEIYCDAGMDSEGCWYGNYCIPQVNEWDGCHGVCPMNRNWETEDWCDMGTDSAGCWMGNWCQDKGMGGCPPPMGGSEMASGEDVCAHMTWTEECNGDQISCDSGYSNEGCWFGNYCIDSMNSWDNCPGMCSQMCNWETEDWCDMGVDSNGCWLGNYCQDFASGGCPDTTMMTGRGAMEKKRAKQRSAK